MWEKKTVMLVPSGAHPAHPIVLPPYPPGGGGGPPGGGSPGVPTFPIWGPPGFNPIGPGYPPGIWGGPIIPPGIPPGGGPPGTPTFPIWGPPGFNPIGPGYPPGIWGGPIIPPPVGPGVPPGGQPSGVPPAKILPPDVLQPPNSPPTDPPDLASPGFYCYLLPDEGTPAPKNIQMGFVQTALDTSGDHVPKLPTEGLPGDWKAVMVYGAFSASYAWFPTKVTGTPPSTTAAVTKSSQPPK